MPNDFVAMDAWKSSACYPRRTFYPLSDDPSIRNHRITMTDFRLCSARRPRSQAGFCHCTIKADFRPALAYHRTPPLLFRRRPPQSNYPPYNVLAPEKWSLVRCQKREGWYLKDDSTKADAFASKSPTYPAHLIPNTSAKL